MSGVTAMGVLAAAAVVGTGVSVYNGIQQSNAQDKAQKQAQQQAQAQADAADKQAAAADQAQNRANQKSPDASAILSAAQQSGKGGASGTMLTGPQGVDPSALALGKNTLLGS